MRRLRFYIGLLQFIYMSLLLFDMNAALGLDRREFPSSASLRHMNTTTLALSGGDITAEAEKYRSIVDIASFGAKCDGINDDSAAINAAFSHVRNSTHQGKEIYPARVVFPAGTCRIDSTLNLTGLQSKSISVEGGGTILISKASGKPAIDAMGTRFLRIKDITIIGDARLRPRIGIQIGRTKDTLSDSADGNSFENVFFDGYFTLAAVYNLNAENTKFDHVFFWNRAANDSYSLIQDGLNHFKISSDFVSLTQPIDKPQSFNENLFLNCDFRQFSGGTPIWMAQTARHRFITSYAAAIGGSVGMKLFSISLSDANILLDVDMHFETDSLKSIFSLVGPNANPRLFGFHYRDHHPFASDSILGTESSIGMVRMTGAKFELGPSQTRKFFDDPSKWFMTGHIVLANEKLWNGESGTFHGLLDMNGVFSVR